MDQPTKARDGNVPSPELYNAIVEAERACRRAHDLCYGPDGRANGATFWLATRLGKCQSILMHYVVKHAGRFWGEIDWLPVADALAAYLADKPEHGRHPDA